MSQFPMNEVIMVSGGFDPFGEHHLDYIKQALALKPRKLICVIMSDKQLMMKKSKINISSNGRQEIVTLILKGLKCSYELFVNNYDTETTLIANALRNLKPDILFRGGDKTLDTMPPQEKEVCDGLGIRIVHGEFRINQHGSNMVLSK